MTGGLHQGDGGSSPLPGASCTLSALSARGWGGAAWGREGPRAEGWASVNNSCRAPFKLPRGSFPCLNHQLRPPDRLPLPLASTCPSVFSGFPCSFILLMIFQRQIFLLLMKSYLFLLFFIFYDLFLVSSVRIIASHEVLRVFLSSPLLLLSRFSRVRLCAIP